MSTILTKENVEWYYNTFNYNPYAVLEVIADDEEALARYNAFLAQRASEAAAKMAAQRGN